MSGNYPRVSGGSSRFYAAMDRQATSSPRQRGSSREVFARMEADWPRPFARRVRVVVLVGGSAFQPGMIGLPESLIASRQEHSPGEH